MANVTELNITSKEPIDFSKDLLELNSLSNFTIDFGSDPEQFQQVVPLDLSVQHQYEYLLTAGGLEVTIGTAKARLRMSLSFLV